jgi:hypothetical protein
MLQRPFSALLSGKKEVPKVKQPRPFSGWITSSYAVVKEGGLTRVFRISCDASETDLSSRPVDVQYINLLIQEVSRAAFQEWAGELALMVGRKR